MTEVQEQVTSDEFSKINTVKFLAGFSNTIGLLVIIVAAGYIWGFNDLQMAQFSQAIGSVLMCVFFYLAWYFLGKRGPAKDVPERENLATAGFKQMLRTAKGLFLYYKRSVFLFFLATSFTSAGKLWKWHYHIISVSDRGLQIPLLCLCIHRRLTCCLYPLDCIQELMVSV